MMNQNLHCHSFGVGKGQTKPVTKVIFTLRIGFALTEIFIGNVEYRKIYTPSCTLRLYTEGKENVIRQTAHNHQPSHTEVLKSAVISSIKYNVSTATPGNVIRDALASAPDDVKAVLPATYLLKKQMRINRKKNQAAPSSPATTADIVIPEEYKRDCAGRLFLQHDTTTEDGHRILIFSTDGVLDAVNTSTINTLLLDGTFKSSPTLFRQVWVIRGRIGEFYIPILYALLEDKRPKSYTAVLEFLHSRCPLINLVNIICDFEKAEHSAASFVFPNCIIKGCLFHFNQAQSRKFLKIPGSNTDDILRVLLSSVYGLPFLPVNDVLQGWIELKTMMWILYPTPAISDYIRYFENTWLFSSAYPVRMWNVFDAVEHDQPRTNNASEGGNNALNRAFDASRPTLWTFISTLRKFHAEAETKHLQISLGTAPSQPVAKKWKVRDEKIKILMNNYNPGNKMDFMIKIGYVLSFL